jgi:cytochrome c oxidase subunit 2
MNHDALSPAGPLSAHIAQTFWTFVGVSAVVYVVVIAFLVFALRRPGATMRNALRGIGVAVGLSAVILVVLALGDFIAGRALAAIPADPLRVRVTAHQWWWEVEYVDAEPARRVRTANELHIPVGRPVLLEMTSNDVIHSFWAPSLNGKKDLIPGYTTTLQLIASRSGRYATQCAEFCGFQHANMGLDVEAHDAAAFNRWYDAQLSPGTDPATPELARGREVFMGSTCVMCHNIQGTDASAVVGPDLTHFGSRKRLAAGTRPNDPGHLAAWITDPQALKPGTHMPATRLEAHDLGALVAYLSSLK